MASRLLIRTLVFTGLVVFFSAETCIGQATSLGNGYTAGAQGIGGSIAAEQGSVVDAIEGNPSGLAGISSKTLEGTGIGVFGSGSFRNAANTDGRLGGVVGAMPYGGLAVPVGNHRWVFSVAETPELLMRAAWRYVDAPGTLGVSYGLQSNEDQIIAMRSSVGIARSWGSKWSAGAALGFVYNDNNLDAPYIFQQQPVLLGLKVLLNLKTHGTGWNGNAGFQWQPNTKVRVGMAWKSGTTIHTTGDASGSASALFAALGVTADPTFHYQAQVLNHLPQGFNGGVQWRSSRYTTWAAQGDFAAWGQAFQQLPVTLTAGTNTTINSVVGSSTMQDVVPLHWNNQAGVHAGVESPLGEHWTLRGGGSWMSNPVPSSTLLPLTAAIMRTAVATGAGWSHGHLHLDGAYQVQLPSSQSVGTSSLRAGEYSNSRVELTLQSVTGSMRMNF